VVVRKSRKEKEKLYVVESCEVRIESMGSFNTVRPKMSVVTEKKDINRS
jgi:hypothetical protein